MSCPLPAALLGLLLPAIGFGLSSTSRAADRTFTPASGDWLTADNQSPNGIPTLSDTVYIGTTMQMRGATLNGSGVAGMLYLGYRITDDGGKGTLTVGGDLSVTHDLVVGQDMSGSLVMKDGGTGPATVDRASSGANFAHTLGTLLIGGSKLSVARGSLVPGTASLTFGATTLYADGTILDTGAGALLTLSALDDQGSARTLTKSGTGALALPMPFALLGLRVHLHPRRTRAITSRFS